MFLDQNRFWILDDHPCRRVAYFHSDLAVSSCENYTCLWRTKEGRDALLAGARALSPRQVTREGEWRSAVAKIFGVLLCTTTSVQISVEPGTFGDSLNVSQQVQVRPAIFIGEYK